MGGGLQGVHRLWGICNRGPRLKKVENRCPKRYEFHNKGKTNSNTKNKVTKIKSTFVPRKCEKLPTLRKNLNQQKLIMHPL